MDWKRLNAKGDDSEKKKGRQVVISPGLLLMPLLVLLLEKRKRRLELDLMTKLKILRTHSTLVYWHNRQCLLNLMASDCDGTVAKRRNSLPLSSQKNIAKI